MRTSKPVDLNTTSSTHQYYSKFKHTDTEALKQYLAIWQGVMCQTTSSQSSNERWGNMPSLLQNTVPVYAFGVDIAPWHKALRTKMERAPEGVVSKLTQSSSSIIAACRHCKGRVCVPPPKKMSIEEVCKGSLLQPMFTSIVSQQRLVAIVVMMGLKDKVRTKYYIEQISQCVEEVEVERWVSNTSRLSPSILCGTKSQCWLNVTYLTCLT